MARLISQLVVVADKEFLEQIYWIRGSVIWSQFSAISGEKMRFSLKKYCYEFSFVLSQKRQIGWIFAYRAVVYVGRAVLFEKLRRIFGAPFSTVHKSYVLILTKMGWTKFWAIFSHTHLPVRNGDSCAQTCSCACPPSSGTWACRRARFRQHRPANLQRSRSGSQSSRCVSTAITKKELGSILLNQFRP
jgi:hypothetical protein